MRTILKALVVVVAAYAVISLILGPSLVAERISPPFDSRVLDFTLNGRNLPLSSASFSKGTFTFNMPIVNPFIASTFLFNMNGLKFQEDIQNGNYVGSVIFVDEDGITQLQGPLQAFDQHTFHWIYNYLNNPSAGMSPDQPTIEITDSSYRSFRFRQLEEAFPQGLPAGCLKIELGNGSVQPVFPGNLMEVTMQSGNGETVSHQLDGGPTRAYIPLAAWGRFGAGVAVTSHLTVTNTEPSPVTVQVQFNDQLGRSIGGVASTTPPFSSFGLELAQGVATSTPIFNDPFTGSARLLTSPDGANVNAGITYEVGIGDEVFGAGLGSPPPSTFNIVPVGRADQTGIAIQNVNSSPVNVEIHFISDQQIIDFSDFSIPSRGRRSEFAYQYFAPPTSQGIDSADAQPQQVLRSSSGYVVIISNRDVAVISLLTKDQLPFASLPAGTP